VSVDTWADVAAGVDVNDVVDVCPMIAAKSEDELVEHIQTICKANTATHMTPDSCCKVLKLVMRIYCSIWHADCPPKGARISGVN
jgi:hypothetical protein